MKHLKTIAYLVVALLAGVALNSCCATCGANSSTPAKTNTEVAKPVKVVVPHTPENHSPDAATPC